MFDVLTVITSIGIYLALSVDKEHLIKSGVNVLHIDLISLLLVNDQPIW